MSDLNKKLEDELAEFLYTGVAEFNKVENGNFLLVRKILALPEFKSIIEKVERYDRFFESLGIGEYERKEFIWKVIKASRLNSGVKKVVKTSHRNPNIKVVGRWKF